MAGMEQLVVHSQVCDMSLSRLGDRRASPAKSRMRLTMDQQVVPSTMGQSLRRTHHIMVSSTTKEVDQLWCIQASRSEWSSAELALYFTSLGTADTARQWTCWR